MCEHLKDLKGQKAILVLVVPEPQTTRCPVDVFCNLFHSFFGKF